MVLNVPGPTWRPKAFHRAYEVFFEDRHRLRVLIELEQARAYSSSNALSQSEIRRRIVAGNRSPGDVLIWLEQKRLIDKQLDQTTGRKKYNYWLTKDGTAVAQATIHFLEQLERQCWPESSKGPPPFPPPRIDPWTAQEERRRNLKAYREERRRPKGS